jgi:putative transposase
MQNEYDLTLLCAALDVSRSGYHAWRGRKPSARQQANTRLLEEFSSSGKASNDAMAARA